MFQVGEYVIHGANGACKVVDVTHLDISGSDKDRQYYVLEPVKTRSSRIYFPVDSDKVPMRKILTREEALQLLDSLQTIQPLEVPSEKFREDTYKAVMKTCDCRSWISMMKTLFQKRKKRLAEGRKFTSVDERYLKAAEDFLFGELSLALEQNREELIREFSGRMEIVEMEEMELQA